MVTRDQSAAIRNFIQRAGLNFSLTVGYSVGYEYSVSYPYFSAHLPCCAPLFIFLRPYFFAPLFFCALIFAALLFYFRLTYPAFRLLTLLCPYFSARSCCAPAARLKNFFRTYPAV